MKYDLSSRQNRLSGLVLGCAAALLVSSPVSATSVGDVQQVETTTTSESAQSQRRIDAIDDETAKIVGEYRATLDQISNLREYNAQLEELIEAQDAEMQSIAVEIEQVTSIDRTIVPLMQRMIEGIDQFVSLDLPFLPSEREARISALRELMNRSDASPAEKFRKILEAYEIENEYGRTIEAYQGPLTTDDGEKTVNFIKYGRLALVYQTFDQTESGYWDQDSQSWVELDGSFSSDIYEGIRVARQQVPPTLITLPVKLRTKE